MPRVRRATGREGIDGHESGRCLDATFELFGERALWTDAVGNPLSPAAELFVHLSWLHIAWSPWANAYVFAGSAIATFAQSRALVDFWIIWMLVDLAGVPPAVKSGLYASGAVYGVFFLLALLGFARWIREYRSRSAILGESVVQGR